MSRVINPESAGKERNVLTRSAAAVVRQLLRQGEVNDETRDLAAYLGLLLEEISKTLDPTVEAWEKRGYWIKADRFRREWQWSETLGARLRTAVLAEDWAGVASTAAQVAEKLGKVSERKRRMAEKPWAGAWQALKRAELS